MTEPVEAQHQPTDSYLSCVICREYVPGTEDDMNTVAWPCAVVQLAALRADTARVPEGLRKAVVDALGVLGEMGNGEGWTIHDDVVLRLWGALSPEDRARTGYDAEVMAADYERVRPSRGYPALATSPEGKSPTG